MKLPLSSVLFVSAALFAVPSPAASVLRSGDYVAICGDSITEQKIYSGFMEEYLLTCQPQPALQVSQFGWGGETSWGFLDRMENDVLVFKPSVATLCYGMNDGNYTKTEADHLAHYTESLTSIVQKFKAAGVREIVVGSPGAVDTTSFKGAFMRAPISPADYNQTLADFSNAAKAVAAKENVIFADIHNAGIDVMAAMKKKYGPAYLLFGDDGIHPKEAGCLVMAYSFLKALGCDGDLGTITLDMRGGRATATGGHKVLSASPTDLQVESTRYPFCFQGDPAKPEATTGVIEFLPFNQDLNRLTFVVRNASAAKLKVTWGETSKVFTAEQLAHGINLAAEFLVNPFSGPFQKVHEAVLRQQNFETPMVKEMIHALPDLKKIDGGKDLPFDALRANLVAIDRGLRTAAVASVVPVKHEIRVEAVTE